MRTLSFVSDQQIKTIKKYYYGHSTILCWQQSRFVQNICYMMHNVRSQCCVKRSSFFIEQIDIQGYLFSAFDICLLIQRSPILLFVICLQKAITRKKKLNNTKQGKVQETIKILGNISQCCQEIVQYSVTNKSTECHMGLTAFSPNFSAIELQRLGDISEPRINSKCLWEGNNWKE